MYEEILQKIEKECEIRNLSPRTCFIYKFHTTKFLEWAGEKPVSELSLYDVRDYILERRDDGATPGYCNCMCSALSFFYKHLLHIPWDLDIVPRMKVDWTLPQTLSLEQIEKLIDTAQNIRNKAIIALVYSSGLRAGEVVRLAPGDIYMSTMQVHIRNSKNRGDHWTILSDRTLELLKQYWYVELYKCAPKTAVITEAGTEAENFPESNKAYATITYEGRTLAQGFNTLALPFNIEASELGNVEKVYAYGGSTITGEGDNAVIHLDFSQEVTSLNANTPYIVKMAAAQSELVFENKTLVVAEPTVTGDFFDFVGTYVALPKGNETIVAGDYISVAAGLKAAAGGNKLNAFRAYLKKNAEVPAGAKVSIMIGGEVVDGTIYNLNGQKVSNAQKGIFIQNGKKVVIK